MYLPRFYSNCLQQNSIVKSRSYIAPAYVSVITQHSGSQSFGASLAITENIWATTRFLREAYGVFRLAARNSSRSPERLATGRNGNSDNFLTLSRNPAETLARGDSMPHISRSGGAQSALMRAARRDSLRATVFLCSTPLVVARCNSGWATRKADCASSLSPVAIAVSTFLTKVRTRLSRERLIAVRFSVCRSR